MREELKTKIRAKLIGAIQAIAEDVGENEWLGADFFWADNTVASMAASSLPLAQTTPRPFAGWCG